MGICINFGGSLRIWEFLFCFDSQANDCNFCLFWFLVPLHKHTSYYSKWKVKWKVQTDMWPCWSRTIIEDWWTYCLGHAKQTHWWTEPPSEVAGFSEDLKYWRAWDATSGLKASHNQSAGLSSFPLGVTTIIILIIPSPVCIICFHATSLRSSLIRKWTGAH